MLRLIIELVPEKLKINLLNDLFEETIDIYIHSNLNYMNLFIFDKTKTKQRQSKTTI